MKSTQELIRKSRGSRGKMTLNTTDKGFDGLWEAVHKVRKNSKMVTVTKRDLENLLMDHSLMYDELKAEDRLR